jgi:hypothetical protein
MTQRKCCMRWWRERGAQHHAVFPDLTPGGSRFGVKQTRMDAVCSVDSRQSGMALRSFRQAATAVHATLQRYRPRSLTAGRLRGEHERVVGVRVEVGRGESCGSSRSDTSEWDSKGAASHPPSHPPALMSRYVSRSTSSPRHSGTLPVPHRIFNPRPKVLLNPGTPCGVRGVTLRMLQ